MANQVNVCGGCTNVFSFVVRGIRDNVKYLLDLAHDIYIWGVLAQLSGDDTSDIWMWYSTGIKWFDYPKNRERTEWKKITVVTGHLDDVTMLVSRVLVMSQTWNDICQFCQSLTNVCMTKFEA